MNTLVLRWPTLSARLNLALLHCVALPPAYLGTAVLLAAAAAARPTLLSPMLLLLILRQAAPLGLAAMGQSLVMRCRSLDLSAGGVVAAVAYLVTSGAVPVSAPLLVALALLLGAAVGAVNGLLITRLKASSVLVTLSVAMILSGSVVALSQFQSPGPSPELLRDFGRARVANVPVPALVWLGALLPAAWFLRRSVFGRTLDAVGANPQAASLSGLPHLRVLFLSHVASGLLSAAGGLLLLSVVGVGNVNLGADLALNSLAAAILGGVGFGQGRGGMAGPAAAAFMLMFLFNFLTSLGLGEAGRLMLQGALIGAAALAYSVRHRDAGH